MFAKSHYLLQESVFLPTITFFVQVLFCGVIMSIRVAPGTDPNLILYNCWFVLVYFLPIFTFCSSFCQVIASSPQSPGRGVTPPCLLAATLSQKERRKIENREIYLLMKRKIGLAKSETELLSSRSISIDYRAHKHLQLWQGNQGHYQSPEMRAWSFQSKKSKGELLS